MPTVDTDAINPLTELSAASRHRPRGQRRTSYGS